MGSEENKNDNDTKKTFDGPGRGRKQCKNCQAYVGVRSAVCVCGVSFPSPGGSPKSNPVPENPASKKISVEPKDKNPEEKTEPTVPHREAVRISGGQAMMMQKGNHITIVPAGECPVKLKSIETKQVLDWALEVQEKYPGTLSPRGLRYWARTQFKDPLSSDAMVVQEILKSEYGE